MKNSIQQRLVNNIVCKHNSDSSLIKLRRFFEISYTVNLPSFKSFGRN